MAETQRAYDNGTAGAAFDPGGPSEAFAVPVPGGVRPILIDAGAGGGGGGAVTVNVPDDPGAGGELPGPSRVPVAASPAAPTAALVDGDAARVVERTTTADFRPVVIAIVVLAIVVAVIAWRERDE